MLIYFKALQALILITFLPMSLQSFAASPDKSQPCETQLTEPNVDAVLRLLKLGLDKGVLVHETIVKLEREWFNPFLQMTPTHESIALVQAWDKVGAPLSEELRNRVRAQLSATLQGREGELAATERARHETQLIIAPVFVDRLPLKHAGPSSPLAFGWHRGRPVIVGRFPGIGQGNSDLLWDYFNKRKSVWPLKGKAKTKIPDIPPQFIRSSGRDYVARPEENLFYDLAHKQNVANEFNFKRPWESHRQFVWSQIISLHNRLYVIATSWMMQRTLGNLTDVYKIPIGEKAKKNEAKLLLAGKNENSGADSVLINGEWIVSLVTNDGPKFFNLNRDFKYPEIYMPTQQRWDGSAVAKVYLLNGRLKSIYSDPNYKKLVIVDVEAGRVEKTLKIGESKELGKLSLVDIDGRPFAIVRQSEKLLVVDLEKQVMSVLTPPFFLEADITPFKSEGRTYLVYGGWDETGLLVYDLSGKFLAGQAGDGLSIDQVLPPFEYNGNLYAYASLTNSGAAIFKITSGAAK